MLGSLCTRRRWLQSTLAAAGGVALAGWPRESRADGDGWRRLDLRTISPQPELYCGWPTVTRLASGRLMVVWSGGREGHVCPFGRVETMISDDDGETWTWPRTLLDSDLDDRDAGVLETPRGTLLVTTFTSTAYVPLLEKGRAAGNWAPERLAAWEAVHRRLSDEQRAKELGTWMIRSTDGGLTWSQRYDSLVNSPHGPFCLRNGRILYAGKQLWRENPRIGVAQSVDDGLTWEWLAEIPPREGDDPRQYHELHGVETDDGRIVVQIRNHNPANNQEVLQTESDDGGRTWSPPRAIGVWGIPSHLLKLRDGRLLMTHGHRRAPIGNQARLSSDGGRTWSPPLVLYGEGNSTDLGYPSTVELASGDLLTLWYELMPPAKRAVLRQMRWRLTSA